MITGMLGSVIFQASRSCMQTFDDYQRTVAPRTATHEIIGQKPVTEYLGPGLDTVSLKIKLSAYWGASPKTEVSKLKKMCETAKPVTLILGLSTISENKWIISSMSETATFYDGVGHIVSEDVSLSLQEYPMNSAEEAALSVKDIISNL